MFLAYTYLTGLTEEEIRQLDERVRTNRQGLVIIRRKICFYIAFTFSLSQPLIASEAMGLPPAGGNFSRIERLTLQDAARLKFITECSKVAPFIEAKGDKIVLTDYQIEKLATVFHKVKDGVVTIDKAILELRGGGKAINTALIVGFLIYLHWYAQNVEAFHQAPLPYMDPLGWFNGVYENSNSNQGPAGCSRNPRRMSRFERDVVQKVTKLCASSMEVTENFYIGDWQALKHLRHAVGLGVNPEDYGMTQEALQAMSKNGGLVAYVRRGFKLPSIEHVQAYQAALKQICLDITTLRRDDITHYDVNGKAPATVFYNVESRHIISFSQVTGDFITGDKQRVTAFARLLDEARIGGNKWYQKWK